MDKLRHFRRIKSPEFDFQQMQRADAEEKRNRDANAAAIAALSSNKTIRQKWDQLGSGSTTVARPRTVRVNIRDAQALFVRDKHCARFVVFIFFALSNLNVSRKLLKMLYLLYGMFQCLGHD